jgi:hypothetical protein
MTFFLKHISSGTSQWSGLVLLVRFDVFNSCHITLADLLDMITPLLSYILRNLAWPLLDNRA